MGASVEVPDRPARFRLGCVSLVILGTLFSAGAAGLALVGFTPYFDALVALCTGWIVFLARTVPKMTLNFSIAGMALLCSLVSLFVGHWLLNSLLAAAGKGRQVWRWRWTVCGFFALGALFLVGMAADGVVHQIGWMVGSDERLVESDDRRLGYVGYRAQSNVIRHYERGAILEPMEREVAEEMLELLFRNVNRTGLYPYQATGAETYQFYVITDESGKYAGMLSFPRVRPAESDYSGRKWIGLIDEPGGRMKKFRTEEELRGYVEKYRNQMRQLFSLPASSPD